MNVSEERRALVRFCRSSNEEFNSFSQFDVPFQIQATVSRSGTNTVQLEQIEKSTMCEIGTHNK